MSDNNLEFSFNRFYSNSTPKEEQTININNIYKISRKLKLQDY